MTNTKLSGSALRILAVFLEVDEAELAGVDIARLANVGSGTLYPFLKTFTGNGWFTSRDEDIDPREACRPRKKFYRLTRDGKVWAREALRPLQMRELRYA